MQSLYNQSALIDLQARQEYCLAKDQQLAEQAQTAALLSKQGLSQCECFCTSTDSQHAFLQSLNNQLAGKDQDLQAQQERHLAKDQQLAQLAQQIEQLESAAEAQQQAETARKAQQSHDWAVNVSLDQGMGEGPVPRVPSSPRALRQRVLVLEVHTQDTITCLAIALTHSAGISELECYICTMQVSPMRSLQHCKPGHILLSLQLYRF